MIIRERRLEPAKGFTLIEVMVALAIVTIALAAGAQASNALIKLAQRQSDILLAQLCAENELARLRLTKQMPDVGSRTFTCLQVGRTFPGTLVTQVTPNPNFRKVEVQVADAPGPDGQATPLLTVSTLVGPNL